MSSFNLKPFLTTAFAIMLLISSIHKNADEAQNKSDTSKVNLRSLLGGDEWRVPDTSSLPKNDSGNMIRYGRELIAFTGNYFGPAGKINHNSNGMNCQNCHLNAGTKL